MLPLLFQDHPPGMRGASNRRLPAGRALAAAQEMKNRLNDIMIVQRKVKFIRLTFLPVHFPDNGQPQHFSIKVFSNARSLNK